MNSGLTSERVYEALKRRLLSGAMLPDEKLEPAVLAAELNSSVTPVRDVLHRLSGERLVESRPSDGFHLPHVNEPALRDLYAWNAQVLQLIVRSWPRGVATPSVAPLPADLGRATRSFFALFASRSGNIEHLAQIESVSDRLAAVRDAEPRVIQDTEAELRSLALDFDHADAGQIAKRVAAYHRRRIRAVPAIVRALYRR